MLEPDFTSQDLLTFYTYGLRVSLASLITLKYFTVISFAVPSSYSCPDKKTRVNFHTFSSFCQNCTHWRFGHLLKVSCCLQLRDDRVRSMAELLEKTQSSYFLAFKTIFREVISGECLYLNRLSCSVGRAKPTCSKVQRHYNCGEGN